MATLPSAMTTSLDDIIKQQKAQRQQKKNENKQNKGPVRGGQRKRDSPYSSSGSENKWKHDKADEQRKPKQNEQAEVRTEEERGFKVQITNCTLSEDEYRTLFEGIALKFVRSNKGKKLGTLFFENKNDALQAVTDFNGKTLDGSNESTVAYVPYDPSKARTDRRPQKTSPRRREPEQRQAKPARGGKINARDLVISVKY